MRNKRRLKLYKNAGTTLVEIIVSFALLAIFLTAAATIISTITNNYYRTKGETYAKQVSDIILEKVVSEIEGAKYEPVAEDETSTVNPLISNKHSSSTITLYDRTDTKVDIYADTGDKELKIYYYPIENKVDSSKSRSATTWKFDKGVYNGYSIESLTFVYGNELSSFSGASDYGFDTSNVTYGNNVIVVFLKMDSPKYDEYYTYRVVKMYNIPDTSN